MKPTVLIYCQHAVGMGHLVRSLAVAGALATRFRVVLLSGGAMPRGMQVPAGVEIIALPPLALQDDRLASPDRRRNVERTQRLRVGRILDTYCALRPAVLVVELFPFGRKKFRFELLPLLQLARGTRTERPLVVCSVRDILVGRDNQAEFDTWAVEHANRYFDAILVHADPALGRLEASLQSRTPLRVPLVYTGFVTGSTRLKIRRRVVVVSAGGGSVGEPLLRAAIEAQPDLWRTDRLRMRLIAGPFLPDPAWQALRSDARDQPGLVVRRFVGDLGAEMAAAAVSVSQCGYNTAMDVLRARVPALVVPFGDGLENEQALRARRLEQLGVVRVLESERLAGATLAAEIRALVHHTPPSVDLDLGGTYRTPGIIADLLASRWPTG